MNVIKSIWHVLNAPILPRPNRDERTVRDATRVLRRLHAQRREVCRERGELARRIVVAARHGDAERITALAGQLEQVVQREQFLDGVLPAKRWEQNGVNEYVFSTRMLAESFRYCTQTPDEGMHFLAGIDVEGVGVGTELIPFAYAYQSVAGAAGDHRATHEICIQMHETGHRLLALVHSHPGSGLHANHHSSTDARTHRLWEKTTRLIGGIWDRTGYLRFFSEGLPFHVTIAGNGMKEIEKNVWQLDYPFTDDAD